MPGRRVITIADGSGPVHLCVELGYGNSFQAAMQTLGISLKPTPNTQELAGDCFVVDDQTDFTKIDDACRIWQARPDEKV